MCVKYVAYAALEPMSLCVAYGDSGTEVNNTACELQQEILQPGSSSAHVPETSNLSENLSSKLRRGVAKWGCNARRRVLCLRLGMCASAWDGWAELHVNPCVAMGYFFLSLSVATIGMGYICTGIKGEGPMYFVVFAPLAFHTIADIGIAVLFWR